MRASLLSLFIQLGLTAAVYSPLREYSGNTFFDKWDFTDKIDDKTWGNVTFLGSADARASKLVDFTPAGNAIIKVDNSTTIAPATLVYRPSVRITSQDTYGVGTLIVADFVHMPYGCSVWPSFWLLGPNLEWPQAGEIDIVEGINTNDKNQMSLHTTEGCTQAPKTDQVGKTLGSNCLSIAGTDHNGCVTEETKPNSFGKGFAQAGGGAYAVQIDVSGIYIWFWSRPNIPASIASSTSASTFDLSDWGAASAVYLSETCNITQFFQPQQMIFDITLCGDWAGAPGIYNATCPGNCVADKIIGPGSPTYDTAYFEIKYIRTYSATPVLAASPPSNSSSGGGQTNPAGNTTSPAGNTTSPAGNTTSPAGNTTSPTSPSAALGGSRTGVPFLVIVLAGALFFLGL